MHEAPALYRARSSTEKSYYSSVRDLWARLLEIRGLPFEVRAETSEQRERGPGADQPDLALYDQGDFVAVLGEVKRPHIEITQMAGSTDRNNQVGRYLSRTGVFSSPISAPSVCSPANRITRAGRGSRFPLKPVI